MSTGPFEKVWCNRCDKYYLIEKELSHLGCPDCRARDREIYERRQREDEARSRRLYEEDEEFKRRHHEREF